MIPSNSGSRGRPSHKELSNKIKECKALVAVGKWLPADPVKLKANLDELEEVFGVETALREDQTNILMAALREITPEHYSGPRPPARSYEPAAYNKELLGFRWTSTFFHGQEMYFKFCVTGAENTRAAFVFSIHPHRADEND